MRNNRPDVTLANKDTILGKLGNIAVPATYQNIIRAEKEKERKFQDPAFEVKGIMEPQKRQYYPSCIRNNFEERKHP